MENTKMSFEQAITLIQADAKRDERILSKVGKLRTEFDDLENRKAAGAISDEDFDRKLQAISYQLDAIINDDLQAKHTNYEKLMKELK